MRNPTSPSRRLRAWLLVATLATVTGACSSSNEPSADTTAPPNTTAGAATSTTAAPSTTTTTLDPVLAEPLPIDPDVRIGTLDNGLQYYIRFNDAPGLRAELRLVVDAGSLHEADDQAGVAHFLEHMMFNGTARFPRNELTSVLESFGPQFGPDINASTSFDETIYELSLESNDELLDLGMDVLREWASEATLTTTDVTEERGVVLEEWRLRDQGLNGRLGQVFEDLMLPGTPYEGKAPIGDSGSIQAMAPEVLTRYYQDWYRSDRMAVVAVGDFDVDEMEQRISDTFGSMTKPEAPEPAPATGVPPTEPIRAASLADPEIALASIEVIWPRPTETMQTVGDLQDEYALAAAMNMLATRLNDDALRGTVPLLNAANSSTPFTRAFGLLVLSAQSRPDETVDALSALATELARVTAYGFSDQEFDRAIEELAAQVELDHEGQATTQDADHAGRIVNHYLAGGPLLSAEQQYEITTTILERLTKADVEAAFVDYLDTTAPRVVVIGPDEASHVPNAAEIEATFAAIPTLAVAPHEDIPEIDALMEPPTPATYTDVTVDENLGFVTITYPNGATVLLWPTTIAESVVSLEAVSFGGTSMVSVPDVPEAQLISEIVGRSGLGPADAATLQLFLADRIVTATPWIAETRESISATAATEDAEVMLQMVNLLMTEPRADQVATDATLAEYLALDASRNDVPDLAVEDQIIGAYYTGDPRYFSVPADDHLADFDPARALEIYRERFGNAGDFVFAIVGDFYPDTMLDLASRYLGTLPGTAQRESFVDHQPLPPRIIQVRTVEAGTDPQGDLQMYFTNQLEPTAKDRLTAQLLGLVVNARLRDRIREQLSATYSPFARISLQRDPDPFVEANIQVSGDPKRLDEISGEVLADLADLVANGPSDAEFATAVQQLRTEMDLISNAQLAAALTASYLYPDQPVSDLIDRYTLIDEITASDVRALAEIAYAPNQRIEIRLVPIGGR